MYINLVRARLCNSKDKYEKSLLMHPRKICEKLVKLIL